MKIAVTGGGGFIGRALISQLKKRGGDYLPVLRTLPRENVPFLQCDLHEKKQVENKLKEYRPDTLLHLAWETTPGVYWNSPENYRWVESSAHLLNCFAESGGRRFIFASTSAIYDWSDGICRESVTKESPATVYGQCKKQFENILASFGRTRDLSTVSARLFSVYGPHESPQRFFPLIINSLLQKSPHDCPSGIQSRDFLYLDDMADALATLCYSELTGPVNIGSGVATQLSTFFDLFEKYTNMEGFLRRGALPDREAHFPLVVADTTKLFEETGWKPSWSIEDGVKHTVKWWNERISV